MKFDPKSQDELNSFELQEGDVTFEVLNAEDTTSKKGNPMIKLKLKIIDINGTQGIVYDYLMTETNYGHLRIVQFLEAIGREDLYSTGQIECLDLVMHIGKALLFLQNDKTGKYKPQFKISEYYKKSSVSEDNDDITF